jgi:hypothetical protein
MIGLAASCTASDDVPAPMISAVNPEHAQPGVSVTIIGDFFCQQPETGGEVDPLACANVGTVNFGPTPANVGMYTEHMITAEVPSLGQRGVRGRFAIVPSVQELSPCIAARDQSQDPIHHGSSPAPACELQVLAPGVPAT